VQHKSIVKYDDRQFINSGLFNFITNAIKHNLGRMQESNITSVNVIKTVKIIVHSCFAPEMKVFTSQHLTSSNVFFGRWVSAVPNNYSAVSKRKNRDIYIALIIGLSMKKVLYCYVGLYINTMHV